MTHTIDITTEVEIARPRSTVAAYVANPDNAPVWHAKTKEIAWESAPPPDVAVAPGTRLSYRERFLGRPLETRYEVTEFVSHERLVMRGQGRFTTLETYTWATTPEGRTRVRLQSRVELGRWAKWLRPLVEAAIRRARAADLARLKWLLEGCSGPFG